MGELEALNQRGRGSSPWRRTTSEGRSFPTGKPQRCCRAGSSRGAPSAWWTLTRSTGSTSPTTPSRSRSGSPTGQDPTGGNDPLPLGRRPHARVHDARRAVRRRVRARRRSFRCAFSEQVRWQRPQARRSAQPMLMRFTATRPGATSSCIPVDPPKTRVSSGRRSARHAVHCGRSAFVPLARSMYLHALLRGERVELSLRVLIHG